MAPLNAKELKVLGYMRWFQARNDNMPTPRVLAIRLGFKAANMHDVVRSLARKGHLASVPDMKAYRFVDRRVGFVDLPVEGSGRDDDEQTVELLKQCLRVQMDDPWIVWSGKGACPVPPGRSIEVRFRDSALESIDALAAQRIRWHHEWSGGDIVAYRLR